MSRKLIILEEGQIINGYEIIDPNQIYKDGNQTAIK